MNNNLFLNKNLISTNSPQQTISGMNARASCYLSKQKTVFSGDTADMFSVSWRTSDLLCCRTCSSVVVRSELRNVPKHNSSLSMLPLLWQMFRRRLEPRCRRLPHPHCISYTFCTVEASFPHDQQHRSW